MAARTIVQIQQSILTAIQNDPILGPVLTSPSSVAYYNLMTYIVATAQALEEQLGDEYIAEVESLLVQAAPATGPWIQNQAFNFQYSATSPQIIQFDPITFAPFWPVVNPSLRIVSRCSVASTYANHVTIKLATGTTPGALSTPQLNAFISFMNQVKPAGIIYDYISTVSDKLYCNSNIKYIGAYSGIISASLLSAYNNFLAAIPFNATFILSNLEVALKAVTGVVDVEFINVNSRADANALGTPYNVVNNFTQALTQVTAFSGYWVDESTSGKDFVSSTNLIAV